MTCKLELKIGFRDMTPTNRTTVQAIKNTESDNSKIFLDIVTSFISFFAVNTSSLTYTINPQLGLESQHVQDYPWFASSD
jgi:hypothetical protein